MHVWYVADSSYGACDGGGVNGREVQSTIDVYPAALPWAALMDAEDLVEFLDELAASAITNAPAETALAEVEATCGRWRAIAEVQHAHNTAAGPDGDEVPDGITRLIAPTRALSADDAAGVKPEAPGIPAAETAPLTIYRASHESIVMGLYTTREAARAHCEQSLSGQYPESTTLVFDWIGDESEPEDPWELVAEIDGGDEQPTGYVVTPLEVASEYDPEAGE